MTTPTTNPGPNPNPNPSPAPGLAAVVQHPAFARAVAELASALHPGCTIEVIPTGATYYRGTDARRLRPPGGARLAGTCWASKIDGDQVRAYAMNVRDGTPVVLTLRTRIALNVAAVDKAALTRRMLRAMMDSGRDPIGMLFEKFTPPRTEHALLPAVLAHLVDGQDVHGLWKRPAPDDDSASDELLVLDAAAAFDVVNVRAL